MKFQIAYYLHSDPHKLTHLKTIDAKDHGEAFSLFWDEFPEQERSDIFILEINMETAL